MARVTVDSEALERSLALLRGLPVATVDVATLMHEVVVAASELFDVTGAGLLFVDEGQVQRFVASSDEPGRLLEKAQEETGVGPCVSSLVEDTVVATSDIQDDDRWTELGAVMAGTSLRAVIGVPIHLSGAAVGCLNAYYDRRHDWTEPEKTALAAYAGVVESMLAAVVSMHRSDELAQQLQHALDSRVVIERAVGWLMSRHGIDAVAAFNVLRTEARGRRRKVVGVAEGVLAGRFTG